MLRKFICPRSIWLTTPIEHGHRDTLARSGARLIRPARTNLLDWESDKLGIPWCRQGRARRSANPADR